MLTPPCNRDPIKPHLCLVKHELFLKLRCGSNEHTHSTFRVKKENLSRGYKRSLLQRFVGIMLDIRR